MDSSSNVSSQHPQQQGVSTMDILAAAFFVVAGAWLFIALLYSTLVLIFLRLRSRGELGSVYDPDFGRMHLCCRFYIPFGCFFRSYLHHLHTTETGEPQRFMTREERRTALETLLLPKETTSDRKNSSKNRKNKKNEDSFEEASADASDLESSQEPMCCICLGHYEQGDHVFDSQTCSHQFHEDCILDWLERQANSECPCCRVPMVAEDDVWTQVEKIRKHKKKLLRRNHNNKKTTEPLPVEPSETCQEEEEEDSMDIPETIAAPDLFTPTTRLQV
jgi:hypothetical protein